MADPVVTFNLIAVVQQRIVDLAGDTNETVAMYFPTDPLSPLIALADASRVDAYNHIKGVLTARGLTAAQVLLWKEGSAFELDLATYFYGQRVGWEKKVDGEAPWISRFDRRKELLKMPILLSDGTVITDEAGDTATGTSGHHFDVGVTRLIGDYGNGQG